LHKRKENESAFCGKLNSKDDQVPAMAQAYVVAAVVAVATVMMIP
jgi:hypothetical protein